MLRKVSWLIVIVVAGLIAFAIARVSAQTPPVVKSEPAPFTPPTDGPGMFKSYCSPCHGISGKGDGPAAAALNPKPADLTLFANRRGGKFSARDFEDKLYGKAMAPAHGSTDMPTWGPVFRQLGNEQLRIANLRTHVESLQVK
jgi:mono/diheme cytochrome c family protein